MPSFSNTFVALGIASANSRTVLLSSNVMFSAFALNWLSPDLPGRPHQECCGLWRSFVRSHRTGRTVFRLWADAARQYDLSHGGEKMRRRTIPAIQRRAFQASER